MAIRPEARPLNATVASRVHDVLLEQIVSGELAGGDRIYQDDLARTLGVSRIPLREGIMALEAEGFILSEPHQGAMVVPLTLEDGRELTQLRATLEGRLLGIACPNMMPEVFAEARAILARLHGPGDPNPSRNLVQWVELNWRFHETLYLPSAQPRTLGIVRNLQLHAQRYIVVQMRMSGRDDRSRDEHYRIVELCERGRVEEAVATLEGHILNILPDLEAADLPESVDLVRVTRSRRTGRTLAEVPEQEAPAR